MYQRSTSWVSAEARTDKLLYQLKPEKKIPWKMGIAPAKADKGDIISWIPGLEKTAVVRMTDDKLRIVGTAIFAKTLFAQEKIEPPNPPDLTQIVLFVDVRTAYILLC